MDLLLGFLVGYYLGTQHGREGLENLTGTVRGLVQNPGVQEVLTTTLDLIEAMVRSVSGRRTGESDVIGFVFGLARELIKPRAA